MREVGRGLRAAAVEVAEDGGFSGFTGGHGVGGPHRTDESAMVGGFLGDNGPGVGARYHRVPAGTSIDIG
ncbi:hypothetical protein [Streptomyces violaceusniger]|uniref:hypothetical protein n=1 Tax=Streptomyces violaceusniger TaxID=68280 RepID=UPI00142F30B5|nr:hypothetical protein [Streptomyces violaceusniger]